MASVPLASVADLADAMGIEDFGDEETRAESMLVRVSSKVRREARRTWVDSSGALSDVPEVIWSIVIDVAIRTFSARPGAYSETTGPTAVMWDRSAQQGVSLTEDELRVVRSFREGSRPGLTSLKTSGLYTPDSIIRTEVAVVGVDGVAQTPLTSYGELWAAW